MTLCSFQLTFHSRARAKLHACAHVSPTSEERVSLSQLVTMTSCTVFAQEELWTYFLGPLVSGSHLPFYFSTCR